MSGANADVGLVGLGVMGRNLAYNVADHGFTIVGMDRDADKVKSFIDDYDSDKTHGVKSIGDLVAGMKIPRAVMLLVPAGKPVDAVIDELKGLLDAGDVIIDGGNSHFVDTDRHAQDLFAKKIDFLGVGVSGGSEGARNGPSMMPGGAKRSYDRVRPILEAIAADVDGEPCVTYLGRGSAGHYVKMVHNGIEYGLMLLISEVYDILKRLGRLSNDELADLFAKWDQGPLKSFLIEITSHIFRFDDDQTNQRLVDMILDAARQKGTGKWTSQDAMELQVPVPTIDAAVGMRYMSAWKEEREGGARVFPPLEIEPSADRKQLIDDLHRALQFAMIVCYAQGMSLLKTASQEYEYGVNLADVARIWRGGCIIRSAALEDIRSAFQSNPDLSNMMLAAPFSEMLKENRAGLCRVIALATESGIAVPGLSSALGYFDSFRTFRLPANLIQAQRDFFGSHTYNRIDRDGAFHTNWS
jgi:6-phosphogluconate dehydrogenase